MCHRDPHTHTHTGGVRGHTHRANAVAGAQGAHKVATASQHCTDDRLGAVELIPDGLAGHGHVRIQHHRQQAGDVNRHPGHCACTLPVVGRQRSVRGSGF